MAISLNEIVSLLSERSGRTFDIPFQEEIKVMVKYWRARVLKQALQRKPRDRRFFLQSFVLELEQVPLVECPIKYGCVLRTKCKVPEPIRSNSVLFDYVGRATWDLGFSYTDESQEMYLSESEYTGNKRRYAYRDGYIYLYNDKKIKYIGIKGIFDEPRDLGNCECNDKPCYSDNDPYPLSSDLIQELVQAILATELRIPVIEEDSEVEVNEKTK